MKLYLAHHSGFCFGVRNAIRKIVEEINADDEEILVYGPLIHNPQTMALLKQRGVTTIRNLDTIDKRTVAIRTHGIPRQEYASIRSRAARILNLTCPRVARIQAIIKKHARMGYVAIIAGDRDHAEVESLKSYAANGVVVISSVNDIPELDKEAKYLLVSQTTFERTVFRDITARLTAMVPDILIIDTICESTGDRQEEIHKRINDGIDTLVVVGGQNSANTRRLAEIGRSNGVRTVQVETADELRPDDFKGSSRILVAAGASTPGWITNQVLNAIYQINTRMQMPVIRGFKWLLEFLNRTHILPAIGAFYLTLSVGQAATGQVLMNSALISFAYIFSMYFINGYLDRESLRFCNPPRYRFYGSNLYRFIAAIAALSVVATIVLIPMNPVSVAITVISYLIGGLYSLTAMRNFIHRMPMRMARRLYHSRIANVIGWIPVVLVAPLIDAGANWESLVVTSLIAIELIFLRTIMSDLVAYQGDLVTGRESLLIWIGQKKTGWIATGSALACMLLIIGLIVSTGNLPMAVYIVPLLYGVILWHLIIRSTFLVPLVMEQLIDGVFLIIAAAYHLQLIL